MARSDATPQALQGEAGTDGPEGETTSLIEAQASLLVLKRVWLGETFRGPVKCFFSISLLPLG